jgi:hypothetical protein
VGTVQQDLVSKLWRKHNPFQGFDARLYRPDQAGWGSDHHYLSEAVDRLRPKIVVEIGVWNGASTRTMADRLIQGRMDGAVICVDTWLGSSEHWISDKFFSDLHFSFGRSHKQWVFMANMVEWGLSEVVVPLPLDSLNAAPVLQHHRIVPDLIHLDGGHDYESVAADLRTWWPLLRPGGMLIGDDYYAEVHWPGVKRAFDEFFGGTNLYPFEHVGGKCRIVKRADS